MAKFCAVVAEQFALDGTSVRCGIGGKRVRRHVKPWRHIRGSALEEMLVEGDSGRMPGFRIESAIVELIPPRLQRLCVCFCNEQRVFAQRLYGCRRRIVEPAKHVNS